MFRLTIGLLRRKFHPMGAPLIIESVTIPGEQPHAEGTRSQRKAATMRERRQRMKRHHRRVGQ